MYVRPELAGSGPPPYGWIPKNAALVWVTSWLIIAIHTWVSMRWSGFPIPLGTASPVRSSRCSRRVRRVGKYYPWLLPMNLFINGRATTAIVRSAAGSIIAVVLGCFEFVRRDVLS
jgi:hypothetical protein